MSDHRIIDKVIIEMAKLGGAAVGRTLRDVVRANPASVSGAILATRRSSEPLICGEKYFTLTELGIQRAGALGYPLDPVKVNASKRRLAWRMRQKRVTDRSRADKKRKEREAATGAHAKKGGVLVKLEISEDILHEVYEELDRRGWCNGISELMREAWRLSRWDMSRLRRRRRYVRKKKRKRKSLSVRDEFGGFTPPEYKPSVRLTPYIPPSFAVEMQRRTVELRMKADARIQHKRALLLVIDRLAAGPATASELHGLIDGSPSFRSKSLNRGIEMGVIAEFSSGRYKLPGHRVSRFDYCNRDRVRRAVTRRVRSIAEIAKYTRIKRQTVKTIVRELRDLGEIVRESEGEYRITRKGKKSGVQRYRR